MSYGVMSLVTKTPIKGACDVTRVNENTVKKRTNLHVDNIMELLIFVLGTTCFRFAGEIYQYNFGVAM